MLSCQRTTEMSGSTDRPWPPTQILRCVSPVTKIWLWFSQLPSLWDCVLMLLFEGDQVCDSMPFSSCSQTHKAQFSPATTKLCGSWLVFFHTCCLAFQNGYKSHGVSQRSTATLKPSWCCSPSVPHLDASPSGLLVLHLVGKLLSSVWWGSKNAEGLEQASLPRSKNMMDLSRRPCCCLSHDYWVMRGMT